MRTVYLGIGEHRNLLFEIANPASKETFKNQKFFIFSNTRIRVHESIWKRILFLVYTPLKVCNYIHVPRSMKPFYVANLLK